jgi:hypothetical protein
MRWNLHILLSLISVPEYFFSYTSIIYLLWKNHLPLSTKSENDELLQSILTKILDLDSVLDHLPYNETSFPSPSQCNTLIFLAPSLLLESPFPPQTLLIPKVLYVKPLSSTFSHALITLRFELGNTQRILPFLF